MNQLPELHVAEIDPSYPELHEPVTLLPLAVVPELGKVPFEMAGIAEFEHNDVEHEPFVVQFPKLHVAEIEPP